MTYSTPEAAFAATASRLGGIFVKSAKYVPTQYTDDPTSNGWTKIDSIQQLKDYQKKISYP